MKITHPTPSQPQTHTPSYIGPITDRVKSDIVKQENEKTEKTPKPRKKRGLYKKTILRQQAEAAAAAAAAGLPPPQFPPLPSSKRNSSSAAHASTNGNNRAEELSATSTVEGLDVDSHKSKHDHAASPTTLEMERELAMLAEEAEEDRRRREEEAADRILKRAQVVKHLRSLKSKLATAQIQIGHDLHYQSIDLFSQLYDEVLEDIGRDNNSEMLNLLKNSVEYQFNHDSDQETSENTPQNSGHMLTRSSDKPKKKDLIPSTSRTHGSSFKSHSSDHKSHVINIDADSDNDSISIKRNRRSKSNSQFVGQSWDIGSGRDGSTSASDNPKYNSRTHTDHRVIHLEEDDGPEIPNPRRPHGIVSSSSRLASQTRGELQLKHRQELEHLQSQQRKDQEEFQRKQLEQLRELQLRQNEELEEFEEAKARRYKEHIEGLAEKRHKISQSLYSCKGESSISRIRRKELYSTSLLYDIDNEFQSHSQDDSPSQSRSPSPSPPQQYTPRQLLDPRAAGSIPASSPNHGSSSRNVSTSSPVPSNPKGSKANESINPLPMSTMTLALTAMNEKKKQLKRAMKKQLEQEDFFDNDTDSPGLGKQPNGTTRRRFLSPPILSQKRSAPDNTTPSLKRSPSFNNSPITKSSSLPASSQHQQPSAGHHSVSYHSPSQTFNDLLHSQSPHTQIQVDGSTSPTPNPKVKKRKNPMSPPSKAVYGTFPSGGMPRNTLEFNKALLNHLDKWNPDEKAGDFFDFVLSDPPDVDVADTEVENILNSGNQPTDPEDNCDLNATPTSKVFKWFQEQQKLAQELERQPKIAPLRLVESDGEEEAEAEAGHHTIGGLQLGDEEQGESSTELIPGEDPLAAFINSKKRLHEARKPVSTAVTSTWTDHGSKEVGENRSTDDSGANQIQTSQQVGDTTSPQNFLSSSSEMLLYPDGGQSDWSFQPFSIDPTEEYLNQETPLENLSF
ncbi:hypothetical protein BGZ49_004973 [Haplosporangium sp. Z 27]|nr:hypothetical protein BGZ49_004973 [Haplosporangium sp. Z 27]